MQKKRIIITSLIFNKKAIKQQGNTFISGCTSLYHKQTVVGFENPTSLEFVPTHPNSLSSLFHEFLYYVPLSLSFPSVILNKSARSALRRGRNEERKLLCSFVTRIMFKIN